MIRKGEKFLLIVIIIFLTGCVKIDNRIEYKRVIDSCKKNNNLFNNVSTGYSYYLPRGVRKLKDYDYNQVFLYNDNKLYLYVDIISYYYKSSLIDKGDESNSYFYSKLNDSKNSGYIRVVKKNNEFDAVVVYNYAKIEFVVSTEYELKKMLAISTIILNSVEYKDSIINKIISGNYGEYSDFKYVLEKPDGSSNSFSEFLEEYVVKSAASEEELPDK